MGRGDIPARARSIAHSEKGKQTKVAACRVTARGRQGLHGVTQCAVWACELAGTMLR